MYDIRFPSGRVKKKFEKLLDSVSDRSRKKVVRILTNNPYPSSGSGGDLLKVERKGKIYCYEISGGDRILFDIVDNPRTVIILYAGNHDGEIKYLKKFSK